MSNGDVVGAPEITANVPAMLERLAVLNDRRAHVLRELQDVNDDIAQVYQALDADLLRIRDLVGLTKKRQMSAEQRLVHGAKLRAAHARKKASGSRWDNQYTKHRGKK